MTDREKEKRNLDTCMAIALWGGFGMCLLWLAFVVFRTYRTGVLDIEGWYITLLVLVIWMALKIKRDALELGQKEDGQQTKKE